MNILAYQPEKLTVFFDAQCGMCVRAASWLEREPCYFPVELLPMQSREARDRYPEIAAELDNGTFVVLDDRGGVYLESSARLMLLYATRRYRPLSLKLSHPALRPLVDRFLNAVGQNRYRISRLLGLKLPASDPAKCGVNGRCPEGLV